jgi:hypothetical protein
MYVGKPRCQEISRMAKSNGSEGKADRLSVDVPCSLQACPRIGRRMMCKEECQGGWEIGRRSEVVVEDGRREEERLGKGHGGPRLKCSFY